MSKKRSIKVMPFEKMALLQLTDKKESKVMVKAWFTVSLH